MIVLITGSNGAQPAALASKLRALVERKSSEEGKAVRFSQSEVSGATVWEIDSQSRNEMVKGLGQTISPTQVYPAMPPQAALPPEAPPLDDSKPPITDFDYHYRPAPKQTEPPAFLKEKTIVYAEVNGGILITSSRSLLEKTLATKDSGRSLATEAAYTAMLDNLVPGSQGLMMINIKKIMQTLKPMMDKNLEGGPIQASDLAGLFGDGLVGLVVSGKYDGRVCTGRMLLPLDFERGIAMIGDGMRSGESMASAPQDEVETIR
jgi:hypothetical protein